MNKIDFKLSDTKNLAMLSILVGLLFLIFPVGLLTGVTFVIGLIGLAFGAFHIYGYFSNSKSNADYPSRLALGLIFATIGIYFVLKPNFIMIVTSFVFGLVVLVFSYFLVQYAMDLKKADYKHWRYTLIAAAVCIIFGILILVDVFPTEKGRMMFIGASLVVVGLAQTVSDIMLNRTGFDKSKIKKAQTIDSSIITNTFDGVKNTITEAVDKVNEKKEDIAEEVKETVEEVKGEAEDKAEEVKKEAEKVVKEVKEDTKKAAKEVKEESKKVADDTKKAAEKKVEKVKEEIKKTSSKASDNTNK